jgi:hypothetical protein
LLGDRRIGRIIKKKFLRPKHETNSVCLKMED